MLIDRNISLLLVLLYLSVMDTQIPPLRVYRGMTDVSGKYPYVVSMLRHKIRKCTGALITSQWVITAARCEEYKITDIQTNFSTYSRSQTISPIIKMIKHPRSRIGKVTINDIGLVLVQKVLLNAFGSLSAMDYSALLGYSVEYAGTGYTQSSKPMKLNRTILKLDQKRPLQIGEGLVISCNLIKESQYQKRSVGPFVCVLPKCNNSRQSMRTADSGATLIFNNKIVGVGSWVFKDLSIPSSAFTPISPYLSWITDVMKQYDTSPTNQPELTTLKEHMPEPTDKFE